MKNVKTLDDVFKDEWFDYLTGNSPLTISLVLDHIEENDDNDLLVTLASELTEFFYFDKNDIDSYYNSASQLLDDESNIILTYREAEEHKNSYIWSTGRVYYFERWVTGNNEEFYTAARDWLIDVDPDELLKEYNKIK